MPEGAVYVGRPSQWGNPWSPKNATRIVMRGSNVHSSRPCTIEECVKLYEEDVRKGTFGYTPKDVRIFLGGKDLACWCQLDQPCHADILLNMAN